MTHEILPHAIGIVVFLAASTAFAAPPEEPGAELPAVDDDSGEAPADVDAPEVSSSETVPKPEVAPPPALDESDHHHHHLPEHEHAPERNPWLGGFGFFSPGILVGNFGDVGGALEDPAALGEGGAPPPYAVTIGGGGGWLLAGTYVIRGKGYYFLTPTTPSSRGQTTYGGGGGGFDFGMVFYNRKQWLLYPYIGIGGIGTELEITNRDSGNITVAGIDLASGEKTKLSSGYFTVEFGFSFQRLMFKKPASGRRAAGGFINGGELGLLMSVHQSQWQNGGTTVNAMPPARMLGFYFRFLMGGGGFSRWEVPSFKFKKGRRSRK